MGDRRSVRPSATFLVAALSLLAMAGCGWFDDPTPDEARVIVTGDPDGDVTIIVSQAFNAGVAANGATQVQLFAADTLVRTLPFDTTFVLVGGEATGDAKRFFFQATRADEDLANFRAQIFLDSDLEFDRGGPLSTEPYLFAYVFNQLLSSIVEVI
jgi:hypothetical protein